MTTYQQYQIPTNTTFGNLDFTLEDENDNDSTAMASICSNPVLKSIDSVNMKRDVPLSNSSADYNQFESSSLNCSIRSRREEEIQQQAASMSEFLPSGRANTCSELDCVRSTRSINNWPAEVLFSNCNQEEPLPVCFQPVNEVTVTDISCATWQEKEAEMSESFDERFREAQISLTSSDKICDLDFSSMREKLEAQKEYLIASFRRQTQARISTIVPKYSSSEKQCTLKMTKRLRRFGKAARHFLDGKILRRPPSVQRCEINLDGFDDNIERFLLVTSLKGRTCAENVYISMPSFFETNRVILPKCLLPSKPGEQLTLSVYGVTGQEFDQLPNFRQLFASGVCTIQFDSKSLVTGRLELQPHRPCHSITGHSKVVQSCGNSMARNYIEPDKYSFATIPKPVAKNFTELCILQSAQPFTELISLSSSTCDSPASFQTQLAAGKYHAASIYRLAHFTIPETFTVVSASPTAFFKTYTSKTAVTAAMKESAEQAIRNVSKQPLLLHSLPLLKPSGIDLKMLMNMFHSGQMDFSTTEKSTGLSENEGLHFCAWQLKTSDICSTESRSKHHAWCEINSCGIEAANPRLPVGSGDFVDLPPLSVFNMKTHLYFADYWNYYDRHFVMLVLCMKGSPCDATCRKTLHRLDPYNNPFFFRTRHYEPEPSIAVYASSNVDVEIIYTQSAAVQNLVSVCSEIVYFSKMQMGGKRKTE